MTKSRKKVSDQIGALEPIAAIEGDDALTRTVDASVDTPAADVPLEIVSEPTIAALQLARTSLHAAYTAEHRAIIAVEDALRRAGVSL